MKRFFVVALVASIIMLTLVSSMIIAVTQNTGNGVSSSNSLLITAPYTHTTRSRFKFQGPEVATPINGCPCHVAPTSPPTNP